MDTEMILVRRVALVATVLGAAAALYAVVTAGVVPAFSVVFGTAVGVGNFWAFAWLLRRVVTVGADTDTFRAGMLLVLKMVLLFGFVWVIWSLSWVSPVWFMVGVSCCVLSLLVSGIWPAPPSSSTPDDTDKGNP